MRARLLTMGLALVMTAPAWAQTNGSSLDLPVSMQKIRDGVAQPGPPAPLKGLDVTSQPTFHVDVTEQQQFEEMLSKIEFETPGPIVAGGIYTYEQQQRLFPPINNPLMQPYAAFTTGQLITLSTEALLERYAGEPALRAINAALQARAQRDARDEVARALADYRAAGNAAAVLTRPALPKD